MSTHHRPAGASDERRAAAVPQVLGGFEERLLSELKIMVAERAPVTGRIPGVRGHAAAGPRSWPVRRLALAGVASAAMAAGVAIAVVVASAAPAGGHAGPAGRQAAPAGRHAAFAPAITAAAVLHNAALAALRMPARTPRPDQFVYTKVYQKVDPWHPSSPAVDQVWTSVSGARFGLVKVLKGSLPPGSPAAGSQIPACVNGRFRNPPGAPPTDAFPHCDPAAWAGYLPNLPTNPAALAHYLRHLFPNRDPSGDDLLLTIESMTTSDYLTPAQRAAMYNLLAHLPGLTVAPHVRNVLGTVGVGIRTGVDKGSHWVIIFDPTTYAPLGLILQRPASPPDGPAVGGEALLQLAIVNQAGQLP